MGNTGKNKLIFPSISHISLYFITFSNKVALTLLPISNI